MPSWETHRRIGEALLGYSYSEVDEHVDKHLGHDSTRYDPNELVILVEKIFKRDGNKVRYAILHHYLDRLVDLVSSVVADLVESCRLDRCTDICDRLFEVREMISLDPCNIFNLFITDPRRIELFVEFRYIGRRYRKRRKTLIERIREQEGKLAKLAISRPNLYYFIKSNVYFVIGKLEDNLKWILGALMFEDEQ